MIIQFSIKNYRSFREEQTLSLVASNRYGDHLDHLTPIPDDDNKLLPVAVVYGANGAGKSNLVKALSLLQRLVRGGSDEKKPIGRTPFAFDKRSAETGTEFSIQFVEGGRVYAFGCTLGDSSVAAEWLSLISDGTEKVVYERVTKANEEVVIEAGPVLSDDSWGNNSKVLALTKVGVLPNQLFLHAAGKSLREPDQGPIVAGALRWFKDRLVVINPTSTIRDLAGLVAKNSSFAAFAGDFLRRVATGVDQLKVESDVFDEKLLVEMSEGIRDALAELLPGKVAIISKPDGNQLILERADDGRIRVRTIMAEHLTQDGDRVSLPFWEESDGTQRVTHLLPALHSVGDKVGTYVIDEIDRSLHPLLAKGFVRSFLGACASKGGQLIFTTHETAFLDLGLLRRDEVWFADKKMAEANTELYSLADYKERRDLRVDRAYLQGRFNAIPPLETELPEWVNSILKEVQPKGTTTDGVGV